MSEWVIGVKWRVTRLVVVASVAKMREESKLLNIQQSFYTGADDTSEKSTTSKWAKSSKTPRSAQRKGGCCEYISTLCEISYCQVRVPLIPHTHLIAMPPQKLHLWTTPQKGALYTKTFNLYFFTCEQWQSGKGNWGWSCQEITICKSAQCLDRINKKLKPSRK